MHHPSGPEVPSPDTGLWRLTRTEYNNTVRDLLGTTSQAANSMTADLSASYGFDNSAQLLQGVVAMDKYEAVAADVVESAFRAGTASRSKLVTCKLDPGDKMCARTIVSAFARRAWRRPVAGDEVDGLMAAVDFAAAQGDGVEEGVKLAFRMVLVSPNFLYRVEIDPPATKGLHPVGAHELATRLSYFVWSSTPDEELLGVADDGTLARPEVFAAQLARMLADQRAGALVDNFADQWLDTRKLAGVAPDPKVFKRFKEDIRQALKGESQAVFKTFLEGERSIVDMLDADFTFANAALAQYYGLAAVTGTGLQRVSVGGNTHRGGLLTQGAFLTVTSNPNRTSPVKRGKWVLSRLLCAPPPDPPAKVPALEESVKAAGLPATVTVREMMRSHRANPTCAACHLAMDAIGFGLEHYDGVGIWRGSYPNNAIDATGEIPGGISFDGAEDLSRKLKQDPRFLQCFARSVFAYALGRDPRTAGDEAAIDELATDFTGRGGRIREVIGLIASSNAFKLRGGGER